MVERRLYGSCASPGLASGPAFLWKPQLAWRTTVDSAAMEATRLSNAVAVALRELRALNASSTAEASAIVDCQIALLEDPELFAQAHTAIADGTPADRAWNDALTVEVAGYESASDEHFRARATDLQDLQYRVLGHLQGTIPVAPIPPGSVVFAVDLPPSVFLSCDWNQGGGLVLAKGSAASHLGTLARARGVPMLTNVSAALEVPQSAEALVDATAGQVVLRPDPETRTAFKTRWQCERADRAYSDIAMQTASSTLDGVHIQLLLNVNEISDLDHPWAGSCHGIGLVRSEFLFGGNEWPDEERQFAAYRRIMEWASPRPVTIRTLDVGGDKPMPGFTKVTERNPALGLRGVRLSLARPESLRVQLRALLRAAVVHPLRIMLPMVSVPEELAQVRAILEMERGELKRAGIPAGPTELGIMVEVPAAALTVEHFDADFYSIGSNDLAQYTMATSRDGDTRSMSFDPFPRAVQVLVTRVVRECNVLGRPVSLCGDLAADPKWLPWLLQTGVRALSVPATALPIVKRAVREARITQCPDP